MKRDGDKPSGIGLPGPAVAMKIVKSAALLPEGFIITA
jgi:hypothetical protein